MDGTNQNFVFTGEEDDDMFDELFMIMIALEESEQMQYAKMPVCTLPLRGDAYTC